MQVLVVLTGVRPRFLIRATWIQSALSPPLILRVIPAVSFSDQKFVSISYINSPCCLPLPSNPFAFGHNEATVCVLCSLNEWTNTYIYTRTHAHTHTHTHTHTHSLTRYTRVYEVDDPGFESRQEQEIFYSPKPSRPVVGSTQPPMQRVPGVFPGVKR